MFDFDSMIILKVHLVNTSEDFIHVLKKHSTPWYSTHPLAKPLPRRHPCSFFFCQLLHLCCQVLFELWLWEWLQEVLQVHFHQLRETLCLLQDCWFQFAVNLSCIKSCVLRCLQHGIIQKWILKDLCLSYSSTIHRVITGHLYQL